MASKPASRRASSPRRRDKEVLEAATKVFYERGYAAASVQDIADELGILKGSVYHYIDTKEDLLFRVLEEVHEEVEAILAEVQELPDLAPLERLHEYVRRQIARSLQDLSRISVYYHELDQLSDGRREEIVRRRAVHNRFVVGLIQEAQDAGEVDPDADPKLLANCVFATMIWIYRWYRPGRWKREAIARQCADFAVRGLQPPR
jgi:AcrR family transcriptional regulator